MNAPTQMDPKKAPLMTVSRTNYRGQPAVELGVANGYFGHPDLNVLLDRLEVLPDPGISNYRKRVVSDPKILDSVREPLKIWFGAGGKYIGPTSW
jgi:hypothetical protein